MVALQSGQMSVILLNALPTLSAITITVHAILLVALVPLAKPLPLALSVFLLLSSLCVIVITKALQSLALAPLSRIPLLGPGLDKFAAKPT